MSALESAASAMVDSAAGKPRPEYVNSMRRPMPADFLAVAPGKTDARLRQHYQAGLVTVVRWRAEARLPQTFRPRHGKRGAPAPDGFAQKARVMHKMALCREFDLKIGLVNRLLADLRIEAAPAPVSGHALGRPAPEDFARSAETMTKARIATLYRVGEATVRRWERETGINVKPSRSRFPRPSAVSAPVDGSVAGCAAQFLRRRLAVYRADICDIRKRAHLPNNGKDHWFVDGHGALTGADLLALAVKKGFDASRLAPPTSPSPEQSL